MKNIRWMLEYMRNDFFEKMQREGYDRETGHSALKEYGEHDMAYDWHDWWDAGDE